VNLLNNLEFEIKWRLQELIKEYGSYVLETPKGKHLVKNLEVLETARKQARRSNLNVQRYPLQ